MVGFLGWEMEERSRVGVLVVDRWLSNGGERLGVGVWDQGQMFFFFVWVRLWLGLKTVGVMLRGSKCFWVMLKGLYGGGEINEREKIAVATGLVEIDLVFF
jgi:hypothetical protein